MLMFRRFLGSRGFVSLLAAVLVAAVAAVAAIVALHPERRQVNYCAIMADAIGLYPGNEVTLRGIKVGSVTGIRADGDRVRVDFRIDAAHPLRAATSAATVSDTIVADRRLAVNDRTGPAWNPATCITTTATPKSITQTLDAFSSLAGQLDTGTTPPGALGAAVGAFGTATAGLGPQLHDIVMQLGVVLRSPDTAIGHIGSLIDTLTSLSHSIAGGWGNLRQMLAGLTPVLQLVNEIWSEVVQLVHSVVVILPLFNDITTKYGGPVLRILDHTVPFLDLVAAHVSTLRQLLDLMPVLAGEFRNVTDPSTGRIAVTYAAPKVALPAPAADQICATLNAITPGKCRPGAGGAAAVDLTTLVLGAAGATP